MALPLNSLSSPALPLAFTVPRGIQKVPLTDYCVGGVGVGDVSTGRAVKIWTVQAINDSVYVSAPGVAQQLVTSHPTGLFLTWVTGTFDQLGRPCCAYTDTLGVSSFYWYDTNLGSFTTTTMNAFTQNPFMIMDDSRDTQNGTCDLILAYVRTNTGHLYYSQQRDRFLVEYDLGAIPAALPAGPYQLTQVGMGLGLRLQFQFQVPLIDLYSPIAKYVPALVYKPGVVSNLKGAIPIIWPVADDTTVRVKP